MAGHVMEERLTRLETALASVEQSVRALEARLDDLDRQAAVTPGDEPAPAWTTSAPFGGANRRAGRAWARETAVKVTALTGGVFLALAGAYLLRALAESGVIPPIGGIALGLGYAVVWFAVASRPRDDRVAAAFHGGIGCTVAFPLVWEATTRFHLLDAASSALLLAAVVGVALAVAARRRLQPLAWIATLAALAFVVALVVATDSVLAYACITIALGIVTLWLGYVCDWFFLRWPVAFVADLMVVGATVRVLSGHADESAVRVTLLALLLPAGYLVNIIVRTVVRGRDVIPFEIVQTIAALAVGLGCASALARHNIVGIDLVGWGTFALGASCYAVAFLFVAQRQGWRANVYFYTSIGLLLVLVSTTLLIADPTLAYAGLAVGAATVAAQSPALLLMLHAVMYMLAAAAASTVLPVAAARWIGSPGTWTPMTASIFVVTVAAGISLVIATRAKPTMAVRVERFAILVLFVWSAGGWLVDLAAIPTAGAPAAFDAGVVATIRTAVIALAAVLAAAVARSDAGREAGWLVYPLLVAGGLKLIVDDVPHSRPATLFIALAVYGIALIAAPRLVRPREDVRRRSSETRLDESWNPDTVR
jgi:hypothetical protein